MVDEETISDDALGSAVEEDSKTEDASVAWEIDADPDTDGVA